MKTIHVACRIPKGWKVTKKDSEMERLHQPGSQSLHFLWRYTELSEFSSSVLSLIITVIIAINTVSKECTSRKVCTKKVLVNFNEGKKLSYYFRGYDIQT